MVGRRRRVRACIALSSVRRQSVQGHILTSIKRGESLHINRAERSGRVFFHGMGDAEYGIIDDHQDQSWDRAVDPALSDSFMMS